jgi:ADP-ribose pyrophosphatase YjhB (NUDIX family)
VSAAPDRFDQFFRLLVAELAFRKAIVIQHDGEFRDTGGGQPELVRSAKTAAAAAVRLSSEGALRAGAERSVPAEVWHTPEFQRWHSAQTPAGHDLKSARPVWIFRSGPGYQAPIWYWALHVGIRIAAEDRSKTNEVVVSRPDIAAVVLHHPGPTPPETRVVLVREFRAPSASRDAYVWELPSGSGEAGAGMASVAIDECAEEVGLNIDPDRLRAHGERQLMSTMSGHRAHLFSVLLSAAEMDAVGH